MANVVFVSFRLKSSDGVSVHAESWIGVLREQGFRVSRVAGYIPAPEEEDHVVPAMNHLDPVIEDFTARALGKADITGSSRAALEGELGELQSAIEEGLFPVLDALNPALMVVENTFSLPLNLPLSLALYRYLEGVRIPCIAVHHDFYWQGERVGDCIFSDLLASHFPAPMPEITHVTINRESRRQLLERTGIDARCIYNCFDFEHFEEADDFNAGLRGDLGFGSEESIFLQPTRAVRRKNIGKSVGFVEEFVKVCGRDARLVVSGPVEDGYEAEFREICRKAEIEVTAVNGGIGSRRFDAAASTRYSIGDLYVRSDVVTFPSSVEGFGNPVIESVVYRKPLLVADYPVLQELRSFGLQFLTLDGQAVTRLMKLLERPQLLEEMLDRNFEIGRKHFSIERLREEFAGISRLVPVLRVDS